MPHAQAIESWSPMPPSGAVTTCATTPVPNRIRIIVPANSAHSSPTSRLVFVLTVVSSQCATWRPSHSDGGCPRQGEGEGSTMPNVGSTMSNALGWAGARIHPVHRARRSGAARARRRRRARRAGRPRADGRPAEAHRARHRAHPVRRGLRGAAARHGPLLPRRRAGHPARDHRPAPAALAGRQLVRRARGPHRPGGAAGDPQGPQRRAARPRLPTRRVGPAAAHR